MTNQSYDTNNNPNPYQQNSTILSSGLDEYRVDKNSGNSIFELSDPTGYPSYGDTSWVQSSQKIRTYDTTSFIELTIVRDEFNPIIEPIVNPQKDIYEKVDKFLKQFEKKDLGTESLEESIELIKQYHFDIDKAEKAVNASLTTHQLNIGKMLCSVKNHVSLSHIKWEPWAEEHLAFMNKRTRQTYMQLAQIKNVEKYVMLGKERLILSYRVIKEVIDQNDDDPIGTFLKRYEINFTKAIELPIAEFKNMLDSAVVVEKASTMNLVLDRQLVEGLVEMGFKFTNSDYTHLQDIQEAEGKPNLILEQLLIHKGQRKNVYDAKEKKKESFIKLNALMKELIDDMIGNKEFDDIETHDVNELINRLQKLMEALKNQTD